MIRAVIFDWGGVLMRTVDASPRLAWDARLGLAPGSVNRLVFESPAWRRAQLGQISDDGVLGRFRREAESFARCVGRISARLLGGRPARWRPRGAHPQPAPALQDGAALQLFRRSCVNSSRSTA